LAPETKPSSSAQNYSWLLALLGILGFAWFRSRVKTPLSKSTNSVHAHDSTNNGTDDSGNDARRGIGITEANHPPTPTQCRYPEKKPKRWYRRWKPYAFVLNIATFIAVAWYARITHNMWEEMQTQTGVLQKANINSERAWVGLDGPITIDSLETMPQLKVESHYSVRNFGHGPAFKVFAHGQFWDAPKLYENVAKAACIGPIEFATGTVPTVPRIRNPGPMGYTLFTNQTHQETIGSPRDPWQGAGEPDMKHFWFIGCVAYLDQFKIVHWTRFCMEPSFSPQDFNKNTPLQFCALYNDAGDGEPPK